MLARWTDAVLAKASAEQLYRDASRSKALAAGQIDELDVQRAREQLLTLLEKLDAREFGEVVTETNHDFDVDSYSPVDFELSTQASVNLARIGGSRLAWHQQDSEFTVFANGTSKRFPIDLQPLVIRFCDMTAVFNVELESAPTVDLVRWLFEQGVLIDHE